MTLIDSENGHQIDDEMNGCLRAHRQPTHSEVPRRQEATTKLWHYGTGFERVQKWSWIAMHEQWFGFVAPHETMPQTRRDTHIYIS